jgi:ribosomal-protein-alanine N-acetyltransferase
MLPSSNFVTIRPATASDIPAMLGLERQSSRAAHWAEQQYQQMFPSGRGERERLMLVAEAALPATSSSPGGSESGTGVVGFLVARHIAPEWELENIVIAPAARRKGLAKRLLDTLLARASETNSDAVFLEVRESNAGARAIYEKLGFQISGRRKSYYADPEEDAVLYRLGLR